jgi:hypothetical protein
MMGVPRNCFPGADWCKTSEIYVPVGNGALNPNKGR